MCGSLLLLIHCVLFQIQGIKKHRLRKPVLKSNETGKRQRMENGEGEISKYESRGCVSSWLFARCPGSYCCGLRFDSFLVEYEIASPLSRKILILCGFFQIDPRVLRRKSGCFCKGMKRGLQKRGGFRNLELCSLPAKNLQKEAYSTIENGLRARVKETPEHLADSF